MEKESETASTIVKVKVGDEEYSIDVKKIPYFESFIRFQQRSGQDEATVTVHDDIPFFGIINDCIEKGYRHFFRRMELTLSDYHVLCETLDYLVIDVLEKRKLSDVLGDLRKGKWNYDPEERREITGLKSVARDAALRLLYLLVLGEFESDVKDSNMAYSAVLFVISHRAIFMYRTRKMVREAYEERFVVSEKQRKALDKWPIVESQESRWKDEEVTTSEEDPTFDSDFDSDYH